MTTPRPDGATDAPATARPRMHRGRPRAAIAAVTALGIVAIVVGIRSALAAAGWCTSCTVDSETLDLLGAVAIAGFAGWWISTSEPVGASTVQEYFDRRFQSENERQLEGARSRSHPEAEPPPRGLTQRIRETPGYQAVVGEGGADDNALPPRDPGPQRRESAGPPREPDRK